MTDALRRQAALRLREMLDKGKPRKMAFLAVRTELRKKGLPNSDASIYVWCRQFKISTR